MKKIITNFEEIEEIYTKLKGENYINGELKETLKNISIPYKDTWDIIFNNAFNDWLMSEHQVFTNDIFLEFIKRNF